MSSFIPPSRLPPRAWGPLLLKVLVLSLVYHLAARLGLSLACVQINTSPVWPPTGIALAALLIFGLEIWPGVALDSQDLGLQRNLLQEAGVVVGDSAARAALFCAELLRPE